MQVLVSVRHLAEARAAAAAGVDFIDLKDPAAGALGGLPPAEIATLVAALRAGGHRGRISATIGDWPATALAEITQRVSEVAAAGVDDVKAGVTPGPGAAALIARLAEQAARGPRIVPVLIADAGIDGTLLHHALATRAFPALMLDTQDKLGGSLLERVAAPALARFVAQVRAAGAEAGLAGALRLADVPALHALGPDFAGFRSAVCEGHRANALCPTRLAALLAAAREPAPLAQ